MGLSLPEDAEPFLNDWDQLSGPGVYALTLTKPENVREAWEQEFDHTPDYMDLLEEKPRVVYVGASANVIRRLEDHRDGEVRKAALLRVCEIESLRNIWFFDDKDKAFQQEWTLAAWMSKHNPEMYVHQR